MSASEAWIKALTFAALPGAATVTFSRANRIDDGTPTTAYALRSSREDGSVIGDERDYDLLKAALSPLEKLSDQEPDGDFEIELNIKKQSVRRV